MIIDATYFIGDIHLPQVGANASTMVNDNALLEDFINQYEPELLNKALGRKLYNEFKLNIDTGSTLIAGADQKWDDLLNGANYEKNGVTYFWRGLIDSSKSLIAYYVYYYMLQSKITQQTTVGTIKAEAKNAASASSTNVMVSAWRKFNEWYQGGGYNKPSIYYYKGVYVEDYFNSDDNSKDVSLYTFLSDNSDNYDDWYFTPIENKNTWGL